MSAVIPVAKLAVHVLSSVGVSKIVNDVIKNNVTIETTADAVKVACGSIVIGSIVADTASRHVTARMDDLATWYEGRKTKETPATA